MTWFYEKRGSEVGPVTEAELNRLHETGVITDSTLIWREGMSNWKTWRDCGPDALTQEDHANRPPALPAVFSHAGFPAAVREAFGLFFSPRGGGILLAGIVVGLLYMIIQALPLINMASSLLTPALLAGLYWYCLGHARRERPRFENIFGGFSRNFAQLILLGVIYLGASLAAILLGVVTFFAFSPSTLIEFFSATGPRSEEPPLAALIAAATAAALPLLYFHFAIMLAPFFLVDRRDRVTAALRNSFVAVHQNFLNFFLWLIVTAVVTIVMTGAPLIPLAIAPGLTERAVWVVALGGMAAVSGGLATLLAIMVLTVMYRDAVELLAEDSSSRPLRHARTP